MFGNVLAAVADVLSTTEVSYSISVVYEHTNQKRNKYSDYVLMKVGNSYVQAVVELKKHVAYDLGSVEINDIAQLFHEVYLCSARYKAVAILGTHTHCHVLVLKIGEGRTLSVLEYYFIPMDLMEDLLLLPLLVSLVEQHFPKH